MYLWEIWLKMQSMSSLSFRVCSEAIIRQLTILLNQNTFNYAFIRYVYAQWVSINDKLYEVKTPYKTAVVILHC